MMNFFILILLMSIHSFASIEIAFIELRSDNGQLIQFESKGQFIHIAISYRGYWLHSHPFRGVEIVSQDILEKMGTIKTIVTIPELSPLSKSGVEKFLGKPYDPTFSWGDEKIYCSELVAKLLNIDPQPMLFEGKVWSERFRPLKGQLGISPDDIFQFLIEKGYKGRNLNFQCLKLFL